MYNIIETNPNHNPNHNIHIKKKKEKKKELYHSFLIPASTAPSGEKKSMASTG